VSWIDERGNFRGRPENVLIQHLFGPNRPAFTVKAPERPGTYRLVILDEGKRPVYSRPYLVSSAFKTSRAAQAELLSSLQVNSVVAQTPLDRLYPLKYTVENRSPIYLQANGDRDKIAPSVRTHPGYGWSDKGSMMIVGRFRRPAGDWPDLFCGLILPHDLAPGESLSIGLPAAWPAQSGDDVVVETGALFSLLGQARNGSGPIDRANVSIKPTRASEIARQPVEPGRTTR
jgi:hypothetical protein